MEEAASLPAKVQIIPMVMDSRMEIKARAKAPVRTAEKVGTAGVVVTVAAAAAEVTAVIRIGDLFTPAAAKAPKKMGGVLTKYVIKRRSLNALQSQSLVDTGHG